MARVPKMASEMIFLACGIHCVEIVYDYHYYQMMLQVNNFFLYKPEAVRSYWLPKLVS